ncbi:MAG: adenylate/guanylate cyclase domain-containing protein [Acidimicrobiales bacterium]
MTQGEPEGGTEAALAAVDQAVMGGAAGLTPAELVAAAGVPAAVAARLWRSLGIPAVSRGQPSFYEADLEALRVALDYLGPDPTEAGALQQVRGLAGAMSRVAEAAVDAWEVSGAELDDSDVMASRREGLEALAVYVLRRQLYAALRRRPARPAEGNGSRVVVGFVDLVRFTALTESVAEEDLARLVARFEEVAFEVVARHGGRVVKTIGDAVMFVADTPAAALRAARALVDAYQADPLVPSARAGLAAGPVLAREGDYFGHPVNLAARIVEVARPGVVVADAMVRQALAGDQDLEWSRLPPKRLKGFGRTELWAVRQRAR